MARMEENIGACRFSWGKLKEKINLKVSDVDGNIILKYILTKEDEGARTKSYSG